ncbi:MAG: ABC transporter ATP-binding protein/permease, partial [Spirochaetia bacterium]|nr:ABC transporter ATP-binding protein/permease [Spirochaetia bacterium]
MLKEYKTIFPYLSKYKYRYIAGILFLMLVDAAQVLIPRFVKQAIDIIALGTFSIQEIWKPVLSMLAVALVISIGRFLWRLFIIGASRQIETEMRDALFSHLLDMSASFYQKNKTGDLMARATNDMNAVRQALGMGFVAFVDGVFMSSMILIAMISDNPAVALYTIIPLPLITVLIFFFGRLVGGQFKKVQEVYSKLSDIAQETLAGMRVVKAFVKEKHFSDQFSRENDHYRDAVMDLVKTFGFFFPLISFLSGISTVILLSVGGNAVIKNRMSPGGIIAMISYLEMLVWPLMGAGFTVNIIQRGAASLKRINEIMNEKPEIASARDTVAQPESTDIEIRNLNFSYPGSSRQALSGISVRLEDGRTLGILGRVGSGKSTLLKTLPRLVDTEKGSVFVGGIDICEYELKSLRSMFGYVPQESFLFSDSVRANICYGKSDISEKRFRELARIASLERDVKLFPAGWDTVVGEKGLTLSGGQKQRIAIARALALDPPILIMDDALSAVDAETEEKILANLLVERKGKTNIIVSHRVSTLRNADLILVLDGGRVIQLGTHEALMAETEGFYAEIARLQELEAAAVSGSK